MDSSWHEAKAANKCNEGKKKLCFFALLCIFWWIEKRTDVDGGQCMWFTKSRHLQINSITVACDGVQWTGN